MQKLVCITGPDGSGKSTLVGILASRLPSCHVANIWDLMDGGISNVPFSSKKEIDGYLCELSPDARLLFLAHALKFSLDRALASGKQTVLLNAYFYKYFVSELALGADNKLVESLNSHFVVPDRVFLLELDSETCASRKNVFSRYESGLSKEPGKNSFVSFQNKTARYWKHFVKNNWHRLDANNDTEKLAQEILNQIS